VGSCWGENGKEIVMLERNLLPIGDKVTLVNACMNNINLYMLSFLEAPKGFLKKANIYIKRMIWEEMDDRNIIWLIGT
jgi:hypothetical protein